MFQITVEYELGSADRAVLVFGASIYRSKSNGCTDFIKYAGHEIRERISAGNHRLSFSLPSGTKQVNAGGAIGFYAAFFNADDYERGRKTLLATLPVAKDYCYEVRR